MLPASAIIDHYGIMYSEGFSDVVWTVRRFYTKMLKWFKGLDLSVYYLSPVFIQI